MKKLICLLALVFCVQSCYAPPVEMGYDYGAVHFEGFANLGEDVNILDSNLIVFGITARKPQFDVTHPDFGATGNGTTDDTAAIQAAIDAAEAAGGGIVAFPRTSNSYLFSSSLIVDDDGVILRGIGVPYDESVHLKFRPAGADNAIEFTGTYDDHVLHSGIENIMIDGADVGDTSVAVVGIKATYFSYFHLSNVCVFRFDKATTGTAVWFSGGDRTTHETAFSMIWNWWGGRIDVCTIGIKIGGKKADTGDDGPVNVGNAYGVRIASSGDTGVIFARGYSNILWGCCIEAWTTGIEVRHYGNGMVGGLIESCTTDVVEDNTDAYGVDRCIRLCVTSDRTLKFNMGSMVDANGYHRFYYDGPSGVELASKHSQLRLTDTDDDQYALWSLSLDTLALRHNITEGTPAVSFADDGKVGIGVLAPLGLLHLNGGMLIQDAVTIDANDTTPDVSGGNIFTTSANTQATAITDLDNPQIGQILYIVGGSNTNSSTIADSGNFALSASWTASLDDVLILLVQADNDYIELGRVDN